MGVKRPSAKAAENKVKNNPNINQQSDRDEINQQLSSGDDQSRSQQQQQNNGNGNQTGTNNNNQDLNNNSGNGKNIPSSAKSNASGNIQQTVSPLDSELPETGGPPQKQQKGSDQNVKESGGPIIGQTPSDRQSDVQQVQFATGANVKRRKVTQTANNAQQNQIASENATAAAAVADSTDQQGSGPGGPEPATNLKDAAQAVVASTTSVPKPSPSRKEDNIKSTSDKHNQQQNQQQQQQPSGDRGPNNNNGSPTASEILVNNSSLESDVQRIYALQAKYDELVSTSESMNELLEESNTKLVACKEMLRVTCVKFYEKERSDRHAKLLEDTVRLGERPVYKIQEQRNHLTKQHTKLRRDRELEERRATEALEREIEERREAQEAAEREAAYSSTLNLQNQQQGQTVTSGNSNVGQNNSNNDTKLSKKNSGESSKKEKQLAASEGDHSNKARQKNSNVGQSQTLQQGNGQQQQQWQNNSIPQAQAVSTNNNRTSTVTESEQDPVTDQTSSLDPATGMVQSAATARALEEENIFERREILNSRTEFLKREELELKEMEQRFISERALHEKRLKLWSYERTSKYNHYPLFRDRYQLGNLLGKGGFSEVYKGVDLENTREIVLKIHEVGDEMMESEKEFYVRHAMREADIQKALNANSIVQLYDVISISENSFATVLEYCGDETLDDYLKGRPSGVLSEKEARGVVIQLMCGLKAMNRREEPIIHYDLKPSNLIYDRGTIKITDFGLSKIVREGGEALSNLVNNGQISQNILNSAYDCSTLQLSDSAAAVAQTLIGPNSSYLEPFNPHSDDLLTKGGRINDTKLTLNPKIRNTTKAEEAAIKTLKEKEFKNKAQAVHGVANAPFPERECDLTSAGCGTYWYLPLECFPRNDDDPTPVKVSNKVDVWSVGVILFEILFGKRPFGHDLSQVKFYHAALKGDENLQVEFPETPRVSKEAQDFIKRLLVPDPELRPSVFEACCDVYLTKGKIQREVMLQTSQGPIVTNGLWIGPVPG